MDWNSIEGNWKQLAGKLKEHWGQLTDDDVKIIDGRRDYLAGKLQERYGYDTDQIRESIDEWLATIHPAAIGAKSAT